jgi:hypothetical protein
MVSEWMNDDSNILPSNPAMHVAHLLTVAPLLAAGSGPMTSAQWFIVLFMTILGVAVTLSPARRTYEVKKPKDD